jgi:hypothetical protein
MGVERWSTGFGPEMYQLQFPGYQSVELARRYPDFHHESPHNILLDAFASQGVAGAASLLLLIGLGFYWAWQARASQPYLAAVLCAMLAGSVVAHQFSCFTLPDAVLFYTTIAFLSVSQAASTAHSILPMRIRFVTRAAAICCAVVFLWFSLRLLIADHALAATKDSISGGMLSRAAQEYARAREWQPPGMSADLWFARSMAAASQKASDLRTRMEGWQGAMQAAVRATSTSEERHNAWYSLASFYAAQNDLPRTEQSLRAAIAASPSWYKPRWMLAQVMQLTGRFEEAMMHASAAVDLNGGRHVEVLKTWEQLRAKAGAKKK